MKLSCAVIRRELERASVTSPGEEATSNLSNHMATCQACAAYYRQLRRLSGELSEALAAPAAPLNFTDTVWRRIETARPVPRKPRLAPALAATVVVAAVVGVMFWSRIPSASKEAPAPISAMSTRPSPAEYAKREKTDETTPKVTPVDIKKVVRDTTVRKNPSRAHHRRRHHSLRRHERIHEQPEAVRVLVKTDAPAKTVKQPQKPQWASWGAWWEARGNYAQAAAAYSRAYEERNDPSLAFAAGRSAECAGNVAQAVEYYTQLLSKKPDASKQPEKGSYLWFQDHDSV